MKAVFKKHEHGEEFFKNSKNFRELLSTVLEEKIKKRIYTTECYVTPSWSHEQAHINGYNAAIETIIDLLKD